jgi:hypothetical protein
MFRRRAGWQHDSAEDTPAKDLETRFVRWSTTTVQGLCVGFTWKAMKAKQSKACKYAGWATLTVGCHVERSAALQVTRAPGRTTERGTCWTEAVLEGVHWHSLAATV